MNKLLARRHGQGMIEYTIILGAVVVLAFLLINKFRPAVESQIETIGQKLETKG